MVDIYLTSPGQKMRVNLHASAKLGERVWDRAWPEYSWWNERGWSTQLNGFQAMTEGRPTFHATPEKEFQLSLARFGKGEWRLMAEVLNDRDGTIAARLPDKADKDDPATYRMLRVR
jgi:hypothetical protein